MAGWIGVHLEAHRRVKLRAGQGSEDPRTERNGTLVGRADVVYFEVQMYLLRCAVRPVGRHVIRGMLHGKDR